jgi:hypothetical protein
MFAWWYWFFTALPLAAWLFTDEPAAYAAALAISALQVAHFFRRHGSANAFPVQVRAVYLLLLAAGGLDPLRFVNWIQLAGTTAMLWLDYCPLARLMSLLPWNRRQPLSLGLVKAVVLTPPRAWPQLRAVL